MKFKNIFYAGLFTLISTYMFVPKMTELFQANLSLNSERVSSQAQMEETLEDEMRRMKINKKIKPMFSERADTYAESRRSQKDDEYEIFRNNLTPVVY